MPAGEESWVQVSSPSLIDTDQERGSEKEVKSESSYKYDVPTLTVPNPGSSLESKISKFLLDAKIQVCVNI